VRAAGGNAVVKPADVIREVAVVSIEDPQWGQAIVAVVVPRSGTTPGAQTLRDHVSFALLG